MTAPERPLASERDASRRRPPDPPRLQPPRVEHLVLEARALRSHEVQETLHSLPGLGILTRREIITLGVAEGPLHRLELTATLLDGPLQTVQGLPGFRLHTAHASLLLVRGLLGWREGPVRSGRLPDPDDDLWVGGEAMAEEERRGGVGVSARAPPFSERPYHRYRWRTPQEAPGVTRPYTPKTPTFPRSAVMASHSPAASAADSASQVDSPTSSSADERPLELAIVGSGPCGIAAGAAARKAGLSTALFDRGPLCDSLVRYPYYMSFFSTPEKLEIEGVPFVTSEKNATRREALVYYRKVAEYFDLPVYQYHEVTGIQGDGEGGFALTTRDRAGRVRRHRARRVVVATGGFHGPNLLNVPGEDLPKVSHHYREAHPYWRQDVLVVGGANSAVESSLELYRAGARVNLVHFEEKFDRGVKPWILPDIQNRIEAGEVGIWWRHRVEEIRPASVVLRSEATGELSEIPNDWVLAMTGWKASPILLAELGVPVDEDTGIPEHDPETMETPVPGVFIAGVLAAGHDANRIFIENGRWHGRAIVASIDEAARRTGGGG